jgi:tetratricopeptide (TPR) repeat protein
MAAADSADALPDWFLLLRDALYEQDLSANDIVPLYRRAETQAEAELSGVDQYLMLSRCEYIMGRAYQYEDRKDEAVRRYEEGMKWAQKALDAESSATGWQMLAENISQSCVVRPVSWVMANGLKVDQYAKKALSLNPRNAAAQHMLAARWIYAPAPLHNFRRGIQMIEEVIAADAVDMQKDDRFNLYSAVGYAYLQQKKYAEAQAWFIKSLTVYPTNKYVQGLLVQSSK